MLERQEFAGVLFATGLTLVAVGLWGLGVSDLYDQIVVGTGVAVSAVAVGWWQLLRRR